MLWMSCVLLCSSIVSAPERRRLCWGCRPPLWCSTMKLPAGASTGDRWQTIRPFASKRKLARFRLRLCWMPVHCLVRLGCVCLYDRVCVFVDGLRYQAGPPTAGVSNKVQAGAESLPKVCHKCDKPGHFKADCPSNRFVRVFLIVSSLCACLVLHSSGPVGITSSRLGSRLW